MWHLVVNALVHLSILLLALFGLWRLHHYTASRFNQFGVHSPTKLAVQGQYEAPPQGQVVLYLVIRLIIPRLIVITAVIGSFLILLYDFEFRSTISTWFNQPGWEWKLPVAFVIGVAINLVVTVERLRSRRMHRLLNVLVILATLGAALMVFDQVRAFGASIITSAGILGLVAGIAAQRTLQNVFAGLQLAITEPIALGDVIEVENAVGTIEEINLSFVSVRLRDLRRLILPVTYFLEKPFTNWTRTSSESLLSFSLILSLDASLAAIRKQVETILHASALCSGGKWEVMISELRESSMVVRITLGASDPEIAFQLKSYVQEHIVDYLNQFKKGSLIGAVADQTSDKNCGTDK
jgi:small-conductance mechanosensitive channel